MKTVVNPAIIVRFFVKIAACALIMSAANAMTDAEAAVPRVTTSVRDAVICAVNVLPKKSVRTVVNIAPTVWSSSVTTAVWDSAASWCARTVRDAAKTAT